MNDASRLGMVSILAYVLAGCSSNSSPASTDAGTDAAAGVSMTVLMLDTGSLAGSVVKGATVAFYPPGGGEVVESVTDDAGLVTFSGIDWSKGEGAVTAYLAGYEIWTLTGITPTTLAANAQMKSPLNTGALPKHDLLWFLLKKGSAAQTAALGGSVLNKQDAAHVAIVSPMGTLGASWEGTKATYQLQVAPCPEFSFIGVEWGPPGVATVSSRGFEGQVFRWAKLDHAVAVAGDNTIPFDFSAATALTPIKFSGKTAIPGGTNGALGGQSFSRPYVSTVESPGVHLGRATKLDVSADGTTFDYDGEYVTIPGSTEHVLTGYNILKQDGARSFVTKLGVPENGATITGFMDPPIVTVSAQGLYDSIAFDGIAAEAFPRAAVLNAGDTVWTIMAPPGTNSVKPPVLPAAAAKLLGSGGLQAIVIALRDPDATVPLFLTASVSRPFTITR